MIAFLAAITVAALPLAGAAETVAVLSSQAAIRAKLGRALKHARVRVVPGNQVARAMRDEHPPLSEADWARIAGKLGIDAFVSGGAPAGGGSGQFEIVIRSGADGSVAGQETVSSRVQPKHLRKLLAASLAKRPDGFAAAMAAPIPTTQSAGGGPAAEASPRVAAAPVARAEREVTSPPPSTNPGAEGGGAEDAEGAGATDNRRAGQEPSAVLTGRTERASPLLEGAVGKLSTFELEADVRELRRTFNYQGGGAAPRYLMTFNPVAGARAAYFLLRNAGIFAAGEFGAGLKTDAYPTGTRELVGGALARFPFSFGQIGASASYFHHAFLVQDTSSSGDPSRLALGVPNTVYSGVRLSAGARVALPGRVQVVVDGAYRQVVSVGDGAGEVRSPAFFPGSSSPYGLDGRAYVGVGLGPMFEARAGIDYRRYVYGGLRGTTAGGDMINASSAVDQYLALSLGLAAVLGPQGK
ncbi:MAG TPA: hypothetical protein VFH68_17195 [Polyangia bacterium]|nr:hypothetical protein [Polyangia bacterium]